MVKTAHEHGLNGAVDQLFRIEIAPGSWVCSSFVELAEECARDGLVIHDQSQHTKAGRRAVVPPHSVSLAGQGWALLRKEKQ
jgi:hypothetical protein